MILVRNVYHIWILHKYKTLSFRIRGSYSYSWGREYDVYLKSKITYLSDTSNKLKYDYEPIYLIHLYPLQKHFIISDDYTQFYTIFTRTECQPFFVWLYCWEYYKCRLLYSFLAPNFPRPSTPRPSLFHFLCSCTMHIIYNKRLIIPSGSQPTWSLTTPYVLRWPPRLEQNAGSWPATWRPWLALTAGQDQGPYSGINIHKFFGETLPTAYSPLFHNICQSVPHFHSSGCILFISVLCPLVST